MLTRIYSYQLTHSLKAWTKVFMSKGQGSKTAAPSATFKNWIGCSVLNLKTYFNLQWEPFSGTAYRDKVWKIGTTLKRGYLKNWFSHWRMKYNSLLASKFSPQIPTTPFKLNGPSKVQTTRANSKFKTINPLGIEPMGNWLKASRSKRMTIEISRASLCKD